MPYVCLNGEFLDAESPYLDASNRSFRYGDGLFESIRLINGKVFNLESHYKRLTEGLKVLKIKMPLALTRARLEELVTELADRNNIKQGGRVRMSVYRSGNGAYIPSSMAGEFLIEAVPYESDYFELNNSGLVVDLYDDIKKPINALAPYKTSNALLYIVASVSAREQGLDDVLLVNENHHIIEGTSSNIFIVSNGVLYTPTVEGGCVGGTFRMYLINLAIANDIDVYECSLTPQNLLAAEEIFFTNSIKGIQWIGSYKTKRYYCDVAKKLIELVNSSVAGSDSPKASNSVQDFQES